MTTSTPDASTTPYLFDNDEPTANEMLDCLSAILDDLTAERLTAAGVGPGGRCLELGAGNGSVAAWMADRVGLSGQVFATDVKPQHVRRHSGVTVLSHNVVTDPLPGGPFDVIHARLLLAHLPQRREVLAKLAELLSPGGAVVIEEWGDSGPAQVLAAPDSEVEQVYVHYNKTLLSLFAAQGNDTSWGRSVNAAMRDAGLVDVETIVHSRSWQGGTAGCRLPIAVSGEVRDRLIEAGMSGEEIDKMHRFLIDSRVVILGNFTYSTIGRRPR